MGRTDCRYGARRSPSKLGVPQSRRSGGRVPLSELPVLLEPPEVVAVGAEVVVVAAVVVLVRPVLLPGVDAVVLADPVLAGPPPLPSALVPRVLDGDPHPQTSRPTNAVHPRPPDFMPPSYHAGAGGLRHDAVTARQAGSVDAGRAEAATCR